MKIPVVLSAVNVDVAADGSLQVDVDGKPYAEDRALNRGDLKSVIEEIASGVGTAVRVDVREADGSTFSDIATPPERPTPAEQEREPETAAPALTGAGFRPGEEVALAYVVARQEADADGNAAINLPPALIAATRQGLVLFGLDSLMVAPIEVSA